MKLSKTCSAALIAIAATSLLVACDVDVADKGKMPDVDVDVKSGQLPEYEVKQTQEGRMPDVDVNATSGKLPDIDVRGPDIDVGEKKIDIPDSITVPTVDVDVPKEKEG